MIRSAPSWRSAKTGFADRHSRIGSAPRTSVELGGGHPWPLEATLAESVLDRAWALAPQVSVRPERFGALLYHFGTRRLSFLKDRRLLEIVQHLDGAPTAGDACALAGVEAVALPKYERALAQLAATDMIRERAGVPA
jgi:putative mycofactocin binding protein MftB